MVSMEFRPNNNKKEGTENTVTKAGAIKRKVAIAGTLLANAITAFAGTPATSKTETPQNEELAKSTIAAQENQPSDLNYASRGQKKEIELATEAFNTLDSAVEEKKIEYIARITLYNETLNRGIEILKNEGDVKGAAKLEEGKKLMRNLETYVDTVRSQAPKWATEDEIIKVAVDHFLDYSNPETGSIVQSIQTIGSHKNLGGTNWVDAEKFKVLAKKMDGEYREATDFLNGKDTTFDNTKSMVPDEKIIEVLKKITKTTARGVNSEDVLSHEMLGNFSQYAKSYIEWKKLSDKLPQKREELQALINKNKPFPFTQAYSQD